MLFCYWWLNSIVVVIGVVNLITLWYPLIGTYMIIIWFLGSWWLTGVVVGDFATLVVGSQEPSSEWVEYAYKV